MEKLNLYLLVDEVGGFVKLTLQGKVLEKKKITDNKKVPKWDALGEVMYIVGQQHVQEFEEKWEIVKKNGEKAIIDIKRRLETYEGKTTEIIFEKYFGNKIVYEDWGIKELEEFGEVEEVEGK